MAALHIYSIGQIRLIYCATIGRFQSALLVESRDIAELLPPMSICLDRIRATLALEFILIVAFPSDSRFFHLLIDYRDFNALELLLRTALLIFVVPAMYIEEVDKATINAIGATKNLMMI